MLDMASRIIASVPYALQALFSQDKIAKVNDLFFNESENYCLACPTTCASCTSSSVCQTCQAGNGLQNNSECAPCPSGTYLTGQDCLGKKLFWELITEIILLACPTTCDTCTSDTVCINCKNGYGLQSNMCSTCPTNTYLSGQDCISKRELCV